MGHEYSILHKEMIRKKVLESGKKKKKKRNKIFTLGYVYIAADRSQYRGRLLTNSPPVSIPTFPGG